MKLIQNNNFYLFISLLFFISCSHFNVHENNRLPASNFREVHSGIEFEGVFPQGVSLSSLKETIKYNLEEMIPEVEFSDDVEVHFTDFKDESIIFIKNGEEKKIEVKSDQSIKPSVGYEGVEITSPVLKNENDYNLWMNIFKKFKTWGIREAPLSGGIHIHVSVGTELDYDRKFIFNFFRFFNTVEDQFVELFQTNPTRSYLVFGKPKDYIKEDSRTIIQYNSMYETFEFRMFNSVLDEDYLDVAHDLVTKLIREYAKNPNADLFKSNDLKFISKELGAKVYDQWDSFKRFSLKDYSGDFNSFSWETLKYRKVEDPVGEYIKYFKSNPKLKDVQKRLLVFLKKAKNHFTFSNNDISRIFNECAESVPPQHMLEYLKYMLSQKVLSDTVKINILKRYLVMSLKVVEAYRDVDGKVYHWDILNFIKDHRSKFDYSFISTVTKMSEDYLLSLNTSDYNKSKVMGSVYDLVESDHPEHLNSILSDLKAKTLLSDYDKVRLYSIVFSSSDQFDYHKLFESNVVKKEMLSSIEMFGTSSYHPVVVLQLFSLHKFNNLTFKKYFDRCLKQASGMDNYRINIELMIKALIMNGDSILTNDLNLYFKEIMDIIMFDRSNSTVLLEESVFKEPVIFKFIAKYYDRISDENLKKMVDLQRVLIKINERQKYKLRCNKVFNEMKTCPIMASRLLSLNL